MLDLHLRQLSSFAPRENTVEVVHLLHDGLCAVAASYRELQQSETGEGYDTGEQMATDLAVGPMEHRIDPHMTACLAHPKLLFNAGAIQRGCDDLLGAPLVMIGDDDVFAHHGLSRGYLGVILTKAHGVLGETEPVVFVADIQILTKLAIAGDDRLGASPMALFLSVLSAVFDQFSPKPIHLSGEVIEFLSFGHRVKGDHHRAWTPPQGHGRTIGFEQILVFFLVF